MTNEERQAKIGEIIALLKEKGVNATCSRCGRNQWQADLIGYFVSALPIEGVTIPPPHIPVLNLTCQNCGSTEFYNLNYFGVSYGG